MCLVGFGPIQNQLLHFFTITLSHSVKAPQHDAHVLGACWGTEELGWNEGSRKKLRDVT